MGARCVLNRINFRNIVAIYRKARESGYDYLIFIPAVDYEGRGFALGKEEQECIKTLLLENQDEFDPGYTNALSLSMRDIRHYSARDYRADFSDPPSGCAAITIRANAFVNYCGGVWLCQPHIGNPLYRIGNVNENPLSTIWNSPQHKAVISLLNAEFSQGACRNCRSIAFNKAANRFDKGEIAPNVAPRDPFV